MMIWPASIGYLALVSTIGSALSLTTSERAQTTALTSSSEGATTATWGRLRNDFAALTSASVSTRTIGSARPAASTKLLAALVDGASNDSASRSANVPAPA